MKRVAGVSRWGMCPAPWISSSTASGRTASTRLGRVRRDDAVERSPDQAGRLCAARAHVAARSAAAAARKAGASAVAPAEAREDEAGVVGVEGGAVGDGAGEQRPAGAADRRRGAGPASRRALRNGPIRAPAATGSGPGIGRKPAGAQSTRRSTSSGPGGRERQRHGAAE